MLPSTWQLRNYALVFRSLLVVLMAVPILAADAPSIALLVDGKNVDAAQLGEAVTSSDALVRATAARVAMVRGVSAVIPQLRTALASETVAESAREQVRALVILGSDDDVAF